MTQVKDDMFRTLFDAKLRSFIPLFFNRLYTPAKYRELADFAKSLEAQGVRVSGLEEGFVDGQSTIEFTGHRFFSDGSSPLTQLEAIHFSALYNHTRQVNGGGTLGGAPGFARCL